jgi:hypothetical protein
MRTRSESPYWLRREKEHEQNTDDVEKVVSNCKDVGRWADMWARSHRVGTESAIGHVGTESHTYHASSSSVFPYSSCESMSSTDKPDKVERTMESFEGSPWP